MRFRADMAVTTSGQRNSPQHSSPSLTSCADARPRSNSHEGSLPSTSILELRMIRHSDEQPLLLMPEMNVTAPLPHDAKAQPPKDCDDLPRGDDRESWQPQTST